MLLERQAFTPQVTPESGNTITVTSAWIEDAQPITRMVLPDTEAGSGVSPFSRIRPVPRTAFAIGPTAAALNIRRQFVLAV